MVYEARHHVGINYALAGACLLVSLIGFAAAGVIPTKSGTNPMVGWAIVVATLLAAAVFVRRALDRTVQARVDAKGVWSRKAGEVPWSDIKGVHVLRAGIQRIARFERAGGKTFGINTTFYDRGISDLLAAVRGNRPDLA
jgi:hypothetical protein